MITADYTQNNDKNHFNQIDPTKKKKKKNNNKVWNTVLIVLYNNRRLKYIRYIEIHNTKKQSEVI